jgi:alanyl-tRNA synthetase
VGGETRVYLGRALEAGPVPARLDLRRRFDHMQQHTGQHLLSALAEDRFGWRTTAFHLGEAYSAVELDAHPLEEGGLRRLEGMINRAIRQALPVRPRLVSAEEYETLEVRTRGLPEDHEGEVRLVEIEDLDLNTCGGTHVESTAVLQVLRLVGTEPMRGGTRLRFLVGGRVLREARRAQQVERELKDLLGCGPEEFARTVERRAGEARALRRRAERAEKELAALTGASLGARSGGRAVHRASGRDASWLQALAAAYLEERPEGVAVLLTELEGAVHFLVVCGEGSGADAAELGGRVAEALGGRGGGRGGRFQGKATDPGRLDAAERLARELLGLEA